MIRQPPPVPISERDLTPDWFGSVFADRIAEAPRQVLTARVGQDYGLSSMILRCRLSGSGWPRSVIVKLWPTDGAAGRNELKFYASFAGNLGIPVPAFHHGAIDEPRGRGVLVLEDLEGAVQGDCLLTLDPRGSVALAATLATLHATWWNRSELHQASWLPPVAVRDPEWLVSRRETFLGRFAHLVDPMVRRLLDRVESVYARANVRLAGAAETLLHADLHLDNVMFVGGSGHPMLLDWARVARGPAAVDLVELLFEMAPVEQVENTCGAYLRELRHRGVGDLDETSLAHQVGGALFRKFVRATCGVARWEPASERERKMIELGFDRITRAIRYWRRRDPELFES